MKINRHGAGRFSFSSPLGALEGPAGRAGRRPCVALAAVLAVAAMVLSAAQAVAQPTLSQMGAVHAPAGTLIRVRVDVFDNGGTNPRFTDAVFSTMEYYDSAYTGIDPHSSSHLRVHAKTAAQLSALASPPDSPFTVTAEVTMANDEGETATGIITFETVYLRTPAALAPPTLSRTTAITVPPGAFINIAAEDVFDNTGTNPKLTEAVFSTTEYLLNQGILLDRLWVHAKTEAGLNAMPSPPESPFSYTAEVTMGNDEGQTATGTLTFETTYDRNPSDGNPSPVLSPGVVMLPAFGQQAAIDAPPGTLVGVDADTAFYNAGTNPRFTNAVFSTTAYYDVSRIEAGRLEVQAKTAEDLNALAAPPDSPFTVTAAVTMTNDEGATATGTLTFETTYARAAAPGTVPAPPGDAPRDPPPALSTAAAVHSAPPGTLVTISAADVFDNAGTNPRFTNAVFSTTAYYDVSRIETGRLLVQAKSATDLNALPSPPDSPFTVTVVVTMTNDEGQAATGRLQFGTSYARTASGSPADVPAGSSRQPGQAD